MNDEAMTDGLPDGHDGGRDENPAQPRRRDREAATRALLDAAKCVFAERGYDAATTREIAARAGFNEQLIQRYFGGKGGLLVAIIDRYGQQEQSACALPAPAGDVEAEIASFLGHQLRHTWQCQDFTKVMLARSLVDAQTAASMDRMVCDARMPGLLERLRQFQARGQIDAAIDLEPVAAGLASLSFTLGFLEQVVFGHDPERVKANLHGLAQVIARGLAPMKRAGD